METWTRAACCGTGESSLGKASIVPVSQTHSVSISAGWVAAGKLGPPLGAGASIGWAALGKSATASGSGALKERRTPQAAENRCPTAGHCPTSPTQWFRQRPAPHPASAKPRESPRGFPLLPASNNSAADFLPPRDCPNRNRPASAGKTGTMDINKIWSRHQVNARKLAQRAKRPSALGAPAGFIPRIPLFLRDFIDEEGLAFILQNPLDGCPGPGPHGGCSAMGPFHSSSAGANADLEDFSY